MLLPTLMLPTFHMVVLSPRFVCVCSLRKHTIASQFRDINRHICTNYSIRQVCILRFACQDEMSIFLAVFFEEQCQLVEAHVICDALHRHRIKHIRQPSVANSQDLLTHFICHRHTSGKGPRHRPRSVRCLCPS